MRLSSTGNRGSTWRTIAGGGRHVSNSRKNGWSAKQVICECLADEISFDRVAKVKGVHRGGKTITCKSVRLIVLVIVSCVRLLCGVAGQFARCLCF